MLPHNRLLIPFLCFCCLLLCSHTAKATNSVFAERTISDTTWHRLTNDKDFGYKDEKEQEKHIKQNEPGILTAIIGAIIVFFNSIAGKIILWLLIISVVGYVVYAIIRDQTSIFSRRKSFANTQEASANDPDLIHTNWEALLQNAITNNDTRLTVRYSYMLLLQLLQQRNIIDYRSDKTNYDYYNELINTPYKQAYRLLTRQYEYTWYGNYALSPTAYDTYMQAFNDMKQQLYQS